MTSFLWRPHSKPLHRINKSQKVYLDAKFWKITKPNLTLTLYKEARFLLNYFLTNNTTSWDYLFPQGLVDCNQISLFLRLLLINYYGNVRGSSRAIQLFSFGHIVTHCQSLQSWETVTLKNEEMTNCKCNASSIQRRSHINHNYSIYT